MADPSASKGVSRYSLLRKTVSRLVPIATRLNERGVKLRFINYNGDSGFNKLKQQDVERAIDTARPNGWTAIGTVLERKIVNPLLEKVNSSERMRCPLLINIITDGEVSYVSVKCELCFTYMLTKANIQRTRTETL
jgi:hypothetical protein